MEIINLTTSLILFLNVTLLSILIPGGPIENRNFDYLKDSPLIYYGFSILLLALTFISLIMCYFLLLGDIWSFKVSVVLGILYFLVYIFDLMKIFPKSPTPMSKTLMLIEIINMMLALLLIIFSMARMSI
ncbi:hypothetical protein [Methanobacterium sp. MBAC-LM]|uniref:hypothetical protein n=1 Tax=Methanobacterium sp. MBAC-LM TaxID=3412034 RepID=UPI003C742767